MIYELFSLLPEKGGRTQLPSAGCGSSRLIVSSATHQQYPVVSNLHPNGRIQVWWHSYIACIVGRYYRMLGNGNQIHWIRKNINNMSFNELLLMANTFTS